MILTIELLKSLKASNDFTIKYRNTSTLHSINLININEIIVSDGDLFNDLSWIVNKLKNKISIKKIVLKDLNNLILQEITYDEKGNQTMYKNSYGFWKKILTTIMVI